MNSFLLAPTFIFVALMSQYSRFDAIAGTRELPSQPIGCAIKSHVNQHSVAAPSSHLGVTAS
jgi:hypothetical protein